MPDCRRADENAPAIAGYGRVLPLVLLVVVVAMGTSSSRPACAQEAEPLASAVGLTGRIFGAGGPAFLAIVLEPAQTIAGFRPSLEAWVGGDVHPVISIAYPVLNVDE